MIAIVITMRETKHIPCKASRIIFDLVVSRYYCSACHLACYRGSCAQVLVRHLYYCLHLRHT